MTPHTPTPFIMLLIKNVLEKEKKNNEKK